MKLPNGYWDLGACKAAAFKYKSITEWVINSSGSYSAAQANGWIVLCCDHMEKKPNHYWTEERCKQNALEFKTKRDWRLTNGAAYRSASNNGWLDECSSHMEKLGSKKMRALYAFEHSDQSVYVGLTYDYGQRYHEHMSGSKKMSRILKEKFKRIGHKFVKYNIFYPSDIAGRKEQELIEQYRADGWTVLNVKEGGDLGGSTLIWTLEACKEDALGYITRNEWRKKSVSAYGSASNNNWLQECCQHMKPPRVFWTFEECVKESLKFTTRFEWQIKAKNSYKAAQWNGWIDKCCAHMSPPLSKGRTSKKMEDVEC